MTLSYLHPKEPCKDDAKSTGDFEKEEFPQPLQILAAPALALPHGLQLGPQHQVFLEAAMVNLQFGQASLSGQVGCLSLSPFVLDLRQTVLESLGTVLQLLVALLLLVHPADVRLLEL